MCYHTIREVIILKTLYIDVYFLINFTVDVLAVFISLKMCHIRIRIGRIIIAGIIGALFAIVNLLLLKATIIRFLLSAALVLLISFCVCTKISLYRRSKFVIFFYMSSMFIGGVVTYVYDLLDEYFGDYFEDTTAGENRRALIFSLVILLFIGVLRILIMVFRTSFDEKSVRICIKICDKTLEVDALVDSGNLVKDPMNMNPVLFIKKIAATTIFPKEVMELSDIDSLDSSYKKRIRLIPVTKNAQTHVMTGVRVDHVYILNYSNKKEEIMATVAIDKEEGTYGGFECLIPYALIRDVF